MIKPALRYHGAKWMLSDWIIAHFPPHEVYVEPFGGSGAVLLKKPRAYAEVFNDLDQRIVTLFRVLRDPELAQRLREQIYLTPFSREEFAAVGYPVPVSDCPVETARQLVLRSYQGFGSNSIDHASGFRANSNRSGSTPVQDWARWPDRVPALTERLRGVVIENRDYGEVMSAHDAPSTLHYLDPPYVLETRNPGKDYFHDFEDDDHHRLAEDANAMSGMVILSGYDCELYGWLFNGWRKVSRPALADGARPRTECLWLNSAAAAALDAQIPRLI